MPPVAAWRDVGDEFVCGPWAFLSRGHVLSCRELRCMLGKLQRKLDSGHRKYSATLLQRLAGRALLWGPPEPSPLDALLDQLTALQQQNLNYCKLTAL